MTNSFRNLKTLQNGEHIGLKKQYWGRHFWTKGYCVSIVGLDEDRIRKYLRWQQKKRQRYGPSQIVVTILPL
jgi:putative transposase